MSEEWTGGPVTLRSGRTVELQPVNLTELLLSGLAPNQVINVCYFYDGLSAKDTAGERVAEILEARLMVIARGLKRPRLRLGPPENIMKVVLNKARGEVGPTFFKPDEITEMYDYVIGEAVPPIADLPFPATVATEPEAAALLARTGDGVQQESE